MLLRVIHESVFEYAPAVKTAQHVTHLRPCDTPWQKVMRHSLSITPEPAQRTDGLDVYGNARTFFSLQSKHEELKVIADSLVETMAPPSVTPHQNHSHLLLQLNHLFQKAAALGCEKNLYGFPG